MASFPAAVKNFLQLQDGVDRVIADHPNQRGDEITAIETLIGALGSDQSYNESIKNLLLNYRRGCSVDYKGAADLYVRSGEIAIPDASGNLRLRRNTTDTTVTWTNLDTGAEANSTQYYVYAVADASGTTFTIKISTSATTPSGATYYKLIGSFYNDASGNIQEVTNSGSYLGFGNWVTKAITTVYQAKTDMLVLAYMVYNSGGETEAKIDGYTDASSSPSTVRQSDAIKYGTAGLSACLILPVRKNDYWKVVQTTLAGSGSFTTTVFAIPMGA